MAVLFSIDRETGIIRLGDGVRLGHREHKAMVEAQVKDLVDGSRDHGNGYEWLHLHGLTLGGRPTGLSLGFQNGLLEQASWSVQMADREPEGSWPSRDAIDAEIEFVRRTLADEWGIRAGSFPWGEVRNGFDAKGFQAASGLRYHPV